MKNFRINRIALVILLSSLLILTLPTAISAQDQQVMRQQVDWIVTDLVGWEKDYLRQLLLNRTSEEVIDPALYNWPTLALARLGYSEGLENYIAETEKYIRHNWESVYRKVTDLERITLAVGAVHSDPRNFGGKDLIAEICNYANIEAQGLNGPLFALIALNSGSYEIPASAKWNKEKLLSLILSKQLPDGGFNLTGTGGSDPDITAMALQALAPYYLAGQAEVRPVVDKALAALSALQNSDGGYQARGIINSESTAQVIIALCSLGIDPDTDSRFIKNGHSLIEHLLTYQTEDGGFKHTLNDQTNSKASEQALLALTAYVRLKDGKSSLYDYRGLSLISARKNSKSTDEVGEIKSSAATGSQKDVLLAPAEFEETAVATTPEEKTRVASGEEATGGVPGTEMLTATPNGDIILDQEAEVAARNFAGEGITSDINTEVNTEEDSARIVPMGVGFAIIAVAAVLLLSHRKWKSKTK